MGVKSIERAVLQKLITVLERNIKIILILVKKTLEIKFRKLVQFFLKYYI